MGWLLNRLKILKEAKYFVPGEQEKCLRESQK
jgi:hypothetical protein